MALKTERTTFGLDVLGRYVNRGPQPMVLRIGEKLRRILLSNDRHALRSA